MTFYDENGNAVDILTIVSEVARWMHADLLIAARDNEKKNSLSTIFDSTQKLWDAADVIQERYVKD